MGTPSGHHVLYLAYTGWLVVLFNERDNLQIFLSLSQNLSKKLLKHSNGKHLYLGIWQHFKYFLQHFSRS